MIKRRPGVCALVIAVLFLLCCLMYSAALAEEAPALSPMLAQWLEKAESGNPQNITLSASLHALVPFGEETLSMMNRILNECRLNVGWQMLSQVETSRTQLLIGQETAVDILEQSGEQTLAQTSLLPGVTLSGEEGSPLSQLLGEETEIPFWAAGVPDPMALAQKIPEALSALSAYAVEKEGSFGLLSVITARKALVYTVPEGEAEHLKETLQKLAEDLSWREAAALFSSVSMKGDAVITLYQTSQGKNVGLGVKATLGFDNVSARTVTFLWAFRSDAEQCIQSLSLKAPAAAGSDDLTVTGKWNLESKKAKNTLSFGLDIKNKLSKKTSREQWTGKLDCLLADDNQRVEGEIKRTVSGPEEDTHTLVIQPSLLAYRSGEEVSLKGNARIAVSKDKAVQTDVTISLAADQSAELVWNSTGDILSLSGMTADQAAELAQTVQANAVASLWQAVLMLPESSLELIKKSIPQEDWDKISQAGFQVSQ